MSYSIHKFGEHMFHALAAVEFQRRSADVAYYANRLSAIMGTLDSGLLLFKQSSAGGRGCFQSN